MAVNTIEYAPVDPKIAHPLGRLKGIIRRYVTIEGLLAVAVFLAAWFWLAMLIDYGTFKLFAYDWALEAPMTLRAIALVIAVVFLLGLLVTRIVLRLTRDFSSTALALVLEKRYPAILGDRLITAVQLSDLNKAREYGYSTDMIKKTVDDVRAKMDQVPVNEVFNWRRLWRRGGLFAMLTVGFFLFTGVAVCAIANSRPKQFLDDFQDVATILVERDVLLRNSPWPRRAFLEVVDFPGEEMRIGRDAPAPKVRVAAYAWVYADTKAAVGWRPLTWADVAKVLPDESISPLPLQPVRDARFAVDLGPLLYGSAHPFTAPTLPADLSAVPEDPALWPVDRVEQVFLKNDEVRALLNAKFSDNLAKIEATMTSLRSKAADPAMSRKLRKLKIPDEVTLFYRGAKTRVDMTLRAESNNEFSGTLTDLKESVRFTARGENYYTPEKLITLVPAPMLRELKRDEYHPAYLYHKAPYADEKDLDNDQKPYRANPLALKGVRHILREQAVSLTGDRSRFDIPYGTEFVLYGKSDKELIGAKLIPKAGKFPGIEADIQAPDDIVLPIANGTDIRFEFTAAKKMMVTRQTEFDIELRDKDNVASKRPVQIVVDEDRPPNVDVVVDVIRKVGNTYLCTPQALIPFTKLSKITDDKGLNRAEFVFSYAEIEPMAVTLKRIEYAMWFWNNPPVLPSLGDPIYRLAAMIENLPRVRPTISSVNDHVPIPWFAEEFRKRPISLAEIQRLLDGPRPTGSELTVNNIVDFRGIEEDLRSLEDAHFAFDLKKVAPGLRKTSETDAQRTYLLTLNVLAVDTNVEAERPGVGQNKEVLVFKLVGDGELLTEISREESGLAEKLDDAIRRLSDVDNKLRSLVGRLPGNTTPEQFLADQTRSNELVELIGKSKDITAEVGTDYARILEEFRVNRLPDHLIKQMETKVVDKLREVLTSGFPESEEAYGKFHAELAQSRAPAPDISFVAQQKITVVLFKLREIRAGIGQGLDLKKFISQFEALIVESQIAKKVIEALIDVGINRTSQITLTPPPAPISIVAGQKATVRVPIEIGGAYDGTFKLKLEPSPNSDLKVLSEIKLKEDDKELVLEITAGFNKGQHWVRITPDAGVAKDVRVIVK